MKFTKDTTLDEILKYRQGKKILAKHKVPCVGCPMAKFEMDKLTLEDISQGYGIDLEQILNELNRALKNDRE